MLPSLSLVKLILVSLAAHAALAGARITTSLYALSMQATEFTVGTLIALFSLFPMLFAVTSGRIIDRIGIVTPIVAGAIAMAIGCMASGIIGGLPVLYLATLLIGTGFMVIQVAAQHTVGAMSSNENRSANFSWLALGFSISGFCGPVIAGFMIDHASFTSSYIVFGLFATVALGLGLFGRLRLIHVALPKTENDRHAGSMLDLLRTPEMRRIYLVGTLLSSAWDLFTFMLPIHGTRAGFSASTIGLILGCFSVATFVVRLAMPWIARHRSEWQVLTAALALAAVCYVLFPFTRQPLSLAIVAAILGLAVGASQPNMLALLHRFAPTGREAEAVGVRVMIGNACQVALPLAFGGAGTAIGVSAVFWGMGALISAGLPLAWRKARQD
ncbi:MFS transporter [Noviherbaspirillum saxi]|uniref:MFS transporter n=1 Tax=Noviherbaspirillum saxi TaxID=2320863 RepID=A0A3A3FTS4_9BURK|nr:MFS transporter [Noviherbaspirillum saxi]RJF97908.1 MFS transporter [Noviherbaspirillum saxi]